MAVDVALAPNALFTLEFFKDYIGSTSLSDTVLTVKINSASSTVQNYLGYDCYRQAVVAEEHRATSDFRFPLRRFPVLSVSEVRYDGTALDVADYEVDTTAGSVRLAYPRFKGSYQVPAYGARVDIGSAQNYYEFDYEAGWVTQAQANEYNGTYEDQAITLPYDIMMACADLASLQVTNHGLAAAGIPTSERIGDAEKEYAASLRRGTGAVATGMSLGMPDWIATRLQRYRMVQVG